MLHRSLWYHVNDKDSSAEYLTAAALPPINTIYSYTMNQQMHIYKYVLSHIIVLHQHASVTPITIIRVSHNKNPISI
jgi:hypothetical protein